MAVMWKDIPLAAKASVATVVVLMGVLGYLSTTFYTRAEAQQYQMQHGQQLSLFRVQQIEQTIENYRFQLLSVQLTTQQREWILAEIKRLQDKIACIQAGTC